MKNRPLLYLCLLMIAVITLSVLCGGEKLIKELRPSPLEETMSSGDYVVVCGQVCRIEQKEKYQVLYLKNNSILNSNSKEYQQQTFLESKIILYTDSKTDSRIQFHIGNKVKAAGEVSFFESARNPGNFDQKRYYQIQDIHCMVWAEKIQITDACVWRWRERLRIFRQRWKEVLVSAMGEEDGTAMGAMMLGEKSEMDQEIKALYQANGIGHILAISGLHLSFIGIGMYKILRRITGSYPVGGAFGILFLMLYILMIGLTVSAVRALVMFLFRVGADMTGRHYDAPTALAAAAVVVLLWRPLSLYDGGFWLSFGAVFAILTVVPVVQGQAEGRFQRNVQKNNSKVQETGKQGRMQESRCRSCDAKLLKRNNRNNQISQVGRTHGDNRRARVYECICRIRVSVMQSFMASAGINLFILPVLLYYFFEFPLYSFILNLFVIPLMSVLLFLGMTGSILFLWTESLAGLIFRLCRMILWIYKESCSIALGLPGASLVAGRPRLWQIAVYYGVLVLVFYLLKSYQNGERYQSYQIQHVQSSLEKTIYSENEREKFRRFKWRNRLSILLWMMGLFILVFRWGEDGKLTAVVLDVGQGDGIFMKGPNGGTYLVDGGSSDVKKVGQYRLEPFLKSQGVGTLDYVLISHGDSDHMNGVVELIERQDIGVKIRTLVLPVQEVWDEALEELAKKAQSFGIRVVTIEAEESIREGEMTLTCIQPGNMEMETADSTELQSGNAASMVLAVQYGEFDMLLTGDVEEEGEEQLTKRLEEQYQNDVWEVLKVAHHGSKNSSTEEFLGQVRSVYALISAGQENRYGHPHQETIERLADVGSKIYSTQENGAIIVGVEGGRTLKIEKY